jgi:hypothetical protein
MRQLSIVGQAEGHARVSPATEAHSHASEGAAAARPTGPNESPDSKVGAWKARLLSLCFSVSVLYSPLGVAVNMARHRDRRTIPRGATRMVPNSPRSA